MKTWKEQIINAFIKLNGVSHLTGIYEEIEAERQEQLPKSWKAIIRGVIERYSSDSEAYGGKEDIFYSVEGLYNGIWGLRNLSNNIKAVDVEEPPKRVMAKTCRIIRDTKLSNDIKRLHDYKCQICGKAIKIIDGFYAEAHHIVPLGGEFKGLDVAENIIVLCPNHHVLCDFGAIKIDINKIRVNRHHNININYIEFHNKKIYKSYNINTVDEFKVENENQ